MLRRRDFLKQLTLAVAGSALLSAVAGVAGAGTGGAVKIFAARSGRFGDLDRRCLLVGGLVVPAAEEAALEQALAAAAVVGGRARRLRFATNPKNAAHCRRALAILGAHPEVRYVGAWIDNSGVPLGGVDHAARRQATEQRAYAGAGSAIEIRALRHDLAVDDTVCRSLAATLGCRVTLLADAGQGSPLMDLAGTLTKALNAADRADAGGNAVKDAMAANAWAAFGLAAGAPRAISTPRLSLRQIRV